MIAVCVRIVAKKGMEARLIEAVIVQAQRSLALEPDCHRFDVSRRVDESTRQEVFLYELYTDKPAFEEHLTTAHFLSFERSTADCIHHKNVLIYDLVEKP